MKKIIFLVVLSVFELSCSDEFSNTQMSDNSLNKSADQFNYGSNTISPYGNSESKDSKIEDIDGNINNQEETVISYNFGSKRDKRLSFFDVDESQPDGIRDVINNLSDTSGGLEGRVQFAQTHTIDPYNIQDKSKKNERREPFLIPYRNALLMFTAKENLPPLKSVKVEITNGSKKMELIMNVPRDMPKSDYAGNGSKPDITYSKRSFSVQLPYDIITPEMDIKFTAQTYNQTEISGILKGSDIDFAAPIEAVYFFLKLDMLAGYLPRGNPYNFSMIEEPARAIQEYFQTIPIAKMVNATYEDRMLKKVIIKDGTIYTTDNPSPYPNPSDHNGDLREDVAKAQVSVGINLANKGPASSALDQNHVINHDMFYFTVHHTHGKYKIRVQGHGLSGGNGIGTLFKSAYSEFSHEVDHGYNKSHYPYAKESSDGCVHGYNTGWGYDAYKNRMKTNIRWNSNGTVEKFNPLGKEHIIEPFQKIYNWNYDSMANGSPSSSISRYVHSTARTMRDVQKFLAERYFLTDKPEIVNGKEVYLYQLWNPWTRKIMKADIEINKRNIKFGKEDVDIFFNGKKTAVKKQEFPVNKNIKEQENFVRKRINDSGLGKECEIVNFVKNSDGTFNYDLKSVFAKSRPNPTAKGVPVITALGGYNPDNPEQTVLYPYFRANYGNVFGDNFLNEKPHDTATYLQIEYYTNKGIQYVKLADKRFNKSVINKLHVNIAESDRPKKITLFVKGQNKGETIIESTIYDKPMPKAAVIGKADGYLDVIKTDAAYLNNRLQGKDINTYVLSNDEIEIVKILAFNKALDKLEEHQRKVAEKAYNQILSLDNVNRYLDNNYEQLQEGDIKAKEDLKQILLENGLGSVEYKFGPTKLRGYCLEVNGIEQGKKYVRTGECKNIPNQKWSIDTYGRIHSALFPDYCLDGNNIANMSLCTQNNSHKWHMVQSSGSEILFKNKGNNKCIDNYNRRNHNNSVGMYNCDKANNNQKFTKPVLDENLYLSIMDGPLINEIWKYLPPEIKE